MRIFIRLFFIGLCSLFLSFGAAAQMAGDSSNITLGAIMAGGGSSLSASYSITGNCPLTGAGVSSSASYQMSGGLIAALFGGAAAANNPPLAECPGDTFIRLCETGEVCLTGFSCSDPDGNLSGCSLSMGVLSGDTVCFTPSGAAEDTIRLIAVDSYGAADTCQTVIRILTNSAPQVVCHADTTLFVCSLGQIQIPGFAADDPDENIASKTVSSGLLRGDTIIFAPVEGTNTLTFIATDSCGMADTCQTTITVNLNATPTATAPNDTTIVVWDLDTICIAGFNWSDPNNNIQSATALGGRLNGKSLCFLPQAGENRIGIIVSDSCGKADTARLTATVTPAYTRRPTDTIAIEADTLKIAYGGGTAVATFNYRLGGQTGYSQAAFIQGAGDTLIYSIPASILTIRGLEYYIEVVHNSKRTYIGSSAQPFRFVTQLTNAQAQRPTALPDAKYKIIGVPINIEGSRTAPAVFLDDLGAVDKKQWRLANYVTSTQSYLEYPNAAQVNPGQGYWLIARGAKKYGAPGFSVLPNREYSGDLYYELALDSGWNQIANPFAFDVDWEDVRFDDNGSVATGHPNDLLDDAAYVYTGSAYATASVISGWDGFFINIKKNGVKILFPFQQSGQGSGGKIFADDYFDGDSPLFWRIRFDLEMKGLSDNANYVGAHPDALSGDDKFDFGEPPPAPDGAYLALSAPESNGRMRIDIRPISEEGYKWNLIFGGGQGRKLKIGEVHNLPVDSDAWLILDNGGEYRIAKDTFLEVPDNVDSAVFLVGSAKYLKSQGVRGIPREYALYPNYPNPFNMSTIVRYALPEAGQTELEIYNILGQKIRTLLSQPMPAGYHQIEWNGIDNSGSPTASGVYFARLKSNEYIGYQKLMLLK
jgi:hypothetical protein